MKTEELLAELEKIAPVALSDEYCAKFSAYDNSGIIVDCKRDVTKVLFALDLSRDAIMECKRSGCDCVVTHHPAIWRGKTRLDAEWDAPLFECVKKGISVISMHLNFDVVSGGIDARLMKALGGKEPVAIMEPLRDSGYGRVYDVPEEDFFSFCARAEKLFSKRNLCYGENRKIRRVASFCGAGAGDDSIEFAIRCGADLFVSSDMKHNEVDKLCCLGVNVISPTHYASEAKSFLDMTKSVAAEKVSFLDEKML